MITDAFDPETEPVVTLEAFYGPRRHLCDVCLITFSKEIHDHLLTAFPCETAAELHGCNGNTPFYTFPFRGRKLAFYLSATGSCNAVEWLLTANWLTGASKFIMFGAAGSLQSAATDGKYVIPTEAYRDEGTSYHYAPPADYINITNADKVAAIFHELRVPCIKGRVWTTDAIFRETRRNVRLRQEDGCIAVEMELAGVQVACNFHGLELYNFLVTGDVLDGPEYSVAGLPAANHSLDKLRLALELATRV